MIQTGKERHLALKTIQKRLEESIRKNQTEQIIIRNEIEKINRMLKR